MGFPKIRGTFLGVPIIRIVIFYGLYWGPLIWGNYPLQSAADPFKTTVETGRTQNVAYTDSRSHPSLSVDHQVDAIGFVGCPLLETEAVIHQRDDLACAG